MTAAVPETVASKSLAILLAHPFMIELQTRNLNELCKAERERIEDTEEARELTPENVRNLARLAAGLLTLGEDNSQFDMAKFRSERGRVTAYCSSTAAPPCGTVACAVGYAPLFLETDVPEQSGDDPIKSAKNWLAYSDEHFGKLPSSLWEWCFGEDWVLYDNRPQGAAARILRLLTQAPAAPWLPEFACSDHDFPFYSERSDPAALYEHLLVAPEYGR